MAVRVEVFSVQCPHCGEFALLRARTEPGPPTPIGFSCPGRRYAGHQNPGRRALGPLLDGAMGVRAKAIVDEAGR
jgi:hypothetical protein